MTWAPFTQPRGDLAARIVGVRNTLRQRAASARLAAAFADDEDQAYLAASLRGKAAAYDEAADLAEALNRGHRLPRRPWSPSPGQRRHRGETQ